MHRAAEISAVRHHGRTRRAEHGSTRPPAAHARLGGLAPCIASTFLFRIGGEEIRCTLRHIEGYDPSAASTRCTFTRLPNG